MWLCWIFIPIHLKDTNFEVTVINIRYTFNIHRNQVTAGTLFWFWSTCNSTLNVIP
ncbi:hypothetical protein ACIAD1918 [Acinetobacter baylyi ADP1]|uniref:Uncharacterized protein n=1 Tax=Acinetobacter baylyi (strain ATCC 33305 / BD413 / ADP1) TaxID=62977 RepID=Q6FB17_ACIAD|nr:hypothetical protein ACIAD1918 [Acinetobacter baylyi ADP1]